MHKDLRTPVPRRDIDVVSEIIAVQVQHRRREFRGGCLVHRLDAVANLLGPQPVPWAGLKSSTLSSSGTSTCLGQPTAKHVVGVGHHLDTDAVQIAVKIACGQVDPPWPEAHPVEQQRREDTGIPG